MTAALLPLPGASKTLPFLDYRGLHCPMPLLKLRRALRDLPAGSEVFVLCSDHTTLKDIPAFCRNRGHRLLETVSLPAAGATSSGAPSENCVLRFRLRCHVNQPSQGGADNGVKIPAGKSTLSERQSSEGLEKNRLSR
ncbi:sulfurtransferase TusA family protein [Oecophyllibacter saccharovorans]|uniref:sulfurtransferase TusA family protein n=2 Tax=Oecophyllibacter saccharovorans TaxID=2558360 RepID=UPI0011734D7C|nr:sulfurtransferase TusA family protein [Oecophyllibacter saccharovorans]